jgi:hypothetical protein
MAVPAPIGLHDIKTEKAVPAPVPYDRDGADPLAVQQAYPEPAGIGSVETIRIVDPRVPALGRRQVDGEIEGVPGHFSKPVIDHLQTFLSL